VGRHTKAVLSFDELEAEIVRGVRSSPDGFISLMTAAKWLSHYPSPIFGTALDGIESSGGAESSITLRGFGLLSNELSKRDKAGEVDVAMPDTSYRKGGYGNTAVSLDLVCDVAYGFNNRELYLLIRETLMAQNSEIEAVKSLFKKSFETVDEAVTALSVHAREVAVEVEPEVVEPEPFPEPLNSWRVVEPQRFQGYRYQLYRFLKSEHAAGKRKPKARDVIEVWKAVKPNDVLEVLDAEIKFYDSSGGTKSVNLKSIQQAIKNLTTVV
jgi:hypothetical protein